MEESTAATPKTLAEIAGGFLTWLGVAVILMTLAWWLTTALHWTNSPWRVATVVGVGASVAASIARFIERRRNA
jgi:hypothetical protein